ncbi:MAG: 50S ribosomal protein L15 [Verrucomicrobiota bacterium]|nr:50S ribosomal protein L15 [Verrucomicrobiota bacterium]
MLLHNIISPAGATHRRKRVGRGEGSGMGKTSCRGGKGQTARAGFSQRPGFESGHVQTHRKLPKRGFSNYNFKKQFAILNVSDLEDLGLQTVDRAILLESGVIRGNEGVLKILGNGDITIAVTVTAAQFSKSAQAKIEKAGGKVICS